MKTKVESRYVLFNQNWDSNTNESKNRNEKTEKENVIHQFSLFYPGLSCFCNYVSPFPSSITSLIRPNGEFGMVFFCSTAETSFFCATFCTAVGMAPCSVKPTSNRAARIASYKARPGRVARTSSCRLSSTTAARIPSRRPDLRAEPNRFPSGSNELG